MKAARNEPPRRKVTPPRGSTTQDIYDECQALTDTLSREHGIRIADADDATQAKYQAFTGHQTPLHPTCALWFAKQCLANGNADLFRQVVTTFQLHRLQGITERADIVVKCLKHLPHVHQIEFISGCELTTDCIAELGDVLKAKRTAPFELDLHGCTLRCEALLALACALPGLHGLAMLSIREAQVPGDEDWITELGAGLAHSTQLLAFKFSVLDLTSEQAEAIGTGARRSRSLTELRLGSNNLTSLAHLLGSLSAADPPDPASPGTGTHSLATLVIVRRLRNEKDRFPSGSVQVLRDLIARYPSLKKIRISPALHVRGFAEIEALMTLCGSDWKDIEIDIEFRVLTNDSLLSNHKLINLQGSNRCIKPSSAYLRRQDALRRLLPDKELRGSMHRLITAALNEKSLPDDVIVEIAHKLVTDRSPPARHLVTLNTLTRINKATAWLDSASILRKTHFERLKSLLTFSAAAFGNDELADRMSLALAGWPLKGRILKTEDDKSLKTLIRTGRPDSDKLEETIRQKEADRWLSHAGQVHYLLKRGFEDEFLAEQQVRYQILNPTIFSPRFDFNIRRTVFDYELSNEFFRLERKKAADAAVKAVADMAHRSTHAVLDFLDRFKTP